MPQKQLRQITGFINRCRSKDAGPRVITNITKDSLYHRKYREFFICLKVKINDPKAESSLHPLVSARLSSPSARAQCGCREFPLFAFSGFFGVRTLWSGLVPRRHQNTQQSSCRGCAGYPADIKIPSRAHEESALDTPQRSKYPAELTQRLRWVFRRFQNTQQSPCGGCVG